MNKNFVKKSAKSHSIDYTKVIKISPDGKYVFSGSGSVYDKDLNRITGFYSHYPGYSDFAVDMTNNYMFAGQVNKSVLVYDYSTFAKLGEVDLIGTITAISVYKDELIAICWDMHKTRVYRISY